MADRHTKDSRPSKSIQDSHSQETKPNHKAKKPLFSLSEIERRFFGCLSCGVVYIQNNVLRLRVTPKMCCKKRFTTSTTRELCENNIDT
jgi:hypothetical protein